MVYNTLLVQIELLSFREKKIVKLKQQNKIK